MKTTLREAFLGPSLVAVALGSLVVGSADRANAASAADRINPGNRINSSMESSVFARADQPLQTGPAIAQPSEKTAFAVTASASQTIYERGAAPELTIEIQNITDKEATLINGSGQKFDFLAFKIGANGEIEAKPTWKWSRGRMFTMMLSTKKLAPNEKLSFKTLWNDAPSGKFQIKGVVTSNGGIEAPPFVIEIK